MTKLKVKKLKQKTLIVRGSILNFCQKKKKKTIYSHYCLSLSIHTHYLLSIHIWDKNSTFVMGFSANLYLARPTLDSPYIVGDFFETHHKTFG